MAVVGESPAEPEALKHLFSYLVNSIDTAALLPAALSKNLITDRQRTECHCEADPYKKANIFLGYLHRAVNADYDNYHTFVHILKQTGQAQIASRLREELTHSIRSMQQPLFSSSTDEVLGEQVERVPNALVEELADLRFAFAKLIRNYEKQLHNSPEAQEEFVAFLPRLFHRSVDDHSFQSHFNTLVEEEVSLFNIFYLKQLCSIFPEDICGTTKQLVVEYEKKLQHFMTGATVNHFKQLFPATATPSKLSIGKLKVKLKIENYWDKSTLDDLTKFVALFGIPDKHLHLSEVGKGCIAVAWLCSTSKVKQLKMGISDSADSLQSLGVLQVFVGNKLVLDRSQFHLSAIVRQLKGPSVDDLPQSTEVQTDELKTVPPLSVSSNESVILNHSSLESRKPVTTLHLIPQVTDIEYQCPVCFEVFADAPTEPYLTDCGHHICGKCRDHLLSTSKKDCPNCRKPDMLNNARCNKHFQRMVENLKVRCSDYEEGCEWEGEVRDLHFHLIQRICFACPFGCGKYGNSSGMKEHTRACNKRMISCENCGYYNTFAIVTEQHYPVCPQSTQTAITPATVSPQYLYNQAPIEFIIGDFSEKKRAIEQWLSVPLYTHNRGYKFLLEVYRNGIGNGSGSHVSVHAELVKGEYDDELKWPFEGDIQIELLNRKEDKNHHSATICFNRHDHTVYRITSQDTATCLGQPHQFVSHTDLAPTSNPKYLLVDFLKLRVSVAVYSLRSLTPSWQMGPGERDVAPLPSHDDSAQPIIAQFTISEFSKRKEFNNMYYSPPFTTSPQGYKFSIKAMADGFSSGKGSHITLNAIIMKGQHDDQLKWPFTGTIIIEILNWREDNRHHKQVYSIDHFTRVTEGEYGQDFGFYKFISHASLPFNSSTNTQYLKDDCICVRVRNSRAADE